MGGTINDILLSAVTGALRRYLEERGEPVGGLNIRAIVPVNLRPPEELGKLGNRFGLVFLSLPVGISDPIKRLVVLKQRMDAIKNSPEAVVALGILNVIGMTPTQIEKIIISIFGMKGSAVMTNVPGPRQMLYLAGKPVTAIMFWVPSPAGLNIGVSIFSYAGDIFLGVATDAGVVADPERIIELFQIEFAYLNSWGRPLEGRSTTEPG
jgi:diacylglycerol O-acyltransferase / wax synthase